MIKLKKIKVKNIHNEPINFQDHIYVSPNDTREVDEDSLIKKLIRNGYLEKVKEEK